MEMIVHLHPEVFEIVKSGVKDVEARVYDEKRRKLKIIFFELYCLNIFKSLSPTKKKNTPAKKWENVSNQLILANKLTTHPKKSATKIYP